MSTRFLIDGSNLKLFDNIIFTNALVHKRDLQIQTTLASKTRKCAFWELEKKWKIACKIQIKCRGNTTYSIVCNKLATRLPNFQK